MGILSFAEATARNLHERYHRRRTLRILENLPPHVRKDIGWPTTGLSAGTRRTQ